MSSPPGQPGLPRPARFRTVRTQFAFQIVAMGLMIVQGLVLVPLYLRHIDPASYGAWLATGNVIAWLGLVDPGASTVLQQRVAAAYGQGRVAHLPRIIGTGLVVSLVFSLAIPLVAAATFLFVPGLVGVSGDFARTLGLAFLLAGLAEGALVAGLSVSTIFAALMTDVALVGISYSVCTAAGIGATVAFLWQGWGVLAIPMGLGVRAGTLLAWNGILLWRRIVRAMGIRPAFSWQEARAVFGLSTYNWGARMGGVFLGNADAIVVARFLGTSEVTTLTVNRRAAELIGNVPMRMNAAASAALAHALGQGDGDAGARAASRLAAWALWTTSIAVGVYVGVNGDFVTLWVGPRFDATGLFVAAAGVAAVWQAVENFGGSLSFAAGRIRSASAVSVASQVVRLAILFAALAAARSISAVPLASVAAAVAFGAWAQATLVSGALGCTRKEAAALLLPLLWAAAAPLAVGILWMVGGPRAHTWPGLVGLAALLGVACTLALAAGSRRFRAELLSLAGSLLRKANAS